MALTPGLLLSDRYRLTSRIAVGGMGEVWAADDTRLARKVAVKILKSELTSDPEFVDRFRAEARITASLNHSGIAAVYDYGEVASIVGGPRDTAYLVMELVTGEPLSAVLTRTPRLSVPRVLDVLEQSGRALQAAHARALVHRDIKPGNILITPTGQVKITDFGIAKVAHQVPVTRGGMVMGTAQYLSPEQAAGNESFPPSDVYALGVVAYEALAGVRPFNGENPIAVAMAHVRDEPPPLPPDIPPPVSALVMRMLAKDAARRFPDGGALARAVAAVRGGARPATAGPITGAFPAGQVTGTSRPATSSTGHPAASAYPAASPQPVYAPPAYAPPVRAATRATQARTPAPYPAPVNRRTGVAVLVAILVLILVAILGAVILTHVGTPGTSADTSAVDSTTRHADVPVDRPAPTTGIADF
ncbi:serine/threonine protein kinase [Nakamurella panacisegetis]|uniref:non-specific serine/threonine protein kinase n=1 Tax=Nakamurella panacisegetis TaxID=1090615 RepID=A0A1H0KQ57_9ACTN|nr:serine/threonine-protein kinase [Nakamurella panacisegetis]SDO57900.1 serine/threonine protein kinase [Nakamurella panacisegetis]